MTDNKQQAWEDTFVGKFNKLIGAHDSNVENWCRLCYCSQLTAAIPLCGCQCHD